MNQFLELPTSGEADRLFPSLLDQSLVRPWRSDQPIPTAGVYIRIGVATWNRYDLRLLDVIAKSIADRNGQPQLVQAFNIAGMHSDDLSAAIPGCGRVLQTPVVGVWRDGILRDVSSGQPARELIARMFGSSSDEIVQFVDQARKSAAS